MAVNRLTLEEMIEVSNAWVSPKSAARKLIENTPTLAPLLPRLVASDHTLHAARPAAVDSAERWLIEKAAAVDHAHDSAARAIHGVLSALALVSQSGERLIEIRDLLLPEGLTHNKKSFRVEAGHGALVRRRLDTALEQELESIRLHDMTLLDLVETWLGCARELGELEAQRAARTPVEAPMNRTRDARLDWIRVANALIAAAELAELDEASMTLLLGPLRDAEAGALRRKRPRIEPDPPVTSAPTSAQ